MMHRPSEVIIFCIYTHINNIQCRYVTLALDVSALMLTTKLFTTRTTQEYKQLYKVCATTYTVHTKIYEKYTTKYIFAYFILKSL